MNHFVVKQCEEKCLPVYFEDRGYELSLVVDGVTMISVTENGVTINKWGLEKLGIDVNTMENYC
jgi:hypothetical protein